MLHRLLRGDLQASEQSWVQRHLDACETCHRQMVVLVQQTALEAAPPTVRSGQVAGTRVEVRPAPPPDSSAVGLSANAVIGGDFALAEPLASGGMGVVYAATQLSTGRRRALKMMHASLATDPDLQARFLKEARVAADIPSEHVVDIVAVGIDERSGAPWLAMEFLEGSDLRDYVSARGPLPLDVASSFIAQACHALGAAHAGGIVHRDLKPSNLFVVSPAQSTQPLIKLVDFGIAKVLSDGSATLTLAMGTPAWMAPEQASEGRDIRPATDVWALGLMVFYMLTGCHYWRAITHGGGIEVLMSEVLFEPLDRGSKRAVDIGAAPFPPALDDWLERCLQRHPDRRFADARVAHAAFREALDQGTTNRSVSTGLASDGRDEGPEPPTVRRPSTSPSRRNPRVIVLGAAASLAAGVGLGLGIFADAPGRDHDTEASPSSATEAASPEAASPEAASPKAAPRTPLPRTAPIPPADEPHESTVVSEAALAAARAKLAAAQAALEGGRDREARRLATETINDLHAQGIRSLDHHSPTSAAAYLVLVRAHARRFAPPAPVPWTGTEAQVADWLADASAIVAAPDDPVSAGGMWDDSGASLCSVVIRLTPAVAYVEVLADGLAAGRAGPAARPHLVDFAERLKGGIRNALEVAQLWQVPACEEERRAFVTEGRRVVELPLKPP